MPIPRRLHRRPTVEPTELVLNMRGVPARIALFTLTRLGNSSSTYRSRIRAGNEALDIVIRVFEMTFSDAERAVQAREVNTLRRLEHPHILPIYGECHLDHNHMAIVMPFVETGSLKSLAGDFPYADKRRLILEVADTVVYLHTIASIVHVDIKPSSVLISPSGSALLTGFNFHAPATLRYAAPELLLDVDLDPSSAERMPEKTTATDIYAFGCLILEVRRSFASILALKEHAADI
ncbi:kinase-like protein [Auricularia subglabra TFB-10046 SS5]|nr:kinase-like protein [Auricularia subglabra TFB-10046 SS5]